MTIRSVKKYLFRACMQRSLLTASLLLTFAAHAQDVANETTFKFAKIPDIGAIGSLSADSANDIWATAVLKPVALHFDGNRSQQIRMVNASRVNKVTALSPSNVWTVGQQTQENLSQIQHFDGTKWTQVPSPHSRNGEVLNSVKAISAKSIFAVGATLGKKNKPAPLIEHFDGSAWRVMAAPRVAGGELIDLAIVSASDIWAVGFDPVSVLVLHFDGTRWSQIAAPGTGVLHAVKSVSANDVWAVGSEVGASALIEHWNGKEWNIVGNPSDINSMLLDLSVISSTDIWAVGCTVTSCGDAGGPALIEHWDGTQWNVNSAPIEDGGEAALTVLTLPSRRIWIGGLAFGTQGPISFLLKGVEGR
jgi:hypothetical protein